MPRTVAIMGVTGRLGPAVARAFVTAGWRVRGLSRRAPLTDEALPPEVAITQGQRSDRAILAGLVDGADAVVDLVCLGAADAALLLDAAAAAAAPPRHLVYASSVAELRADPADAYGQGKRAARLEYARFPGTLHTLVLPRLVAPVDPRQRERPYLDAAFASGSALVANGGQQRQAIAPVEGVAQAVLRLVEEGSPSATLNVAPPAPVRVREAVEALLVGAGLSATTARHPDKAWRGPHGGGEELLDTSALQRLLPGLAWPDVLEAHRRLGAWMVKRPPEAKRPAALVKFGHRAPEQRRLVDVHGRRREPVLRERLPELERVTQWVTPGFYLEVGRPCNSACVYCSVPPHGDTRGFTPLSTLVAGAEAGRAAGADRAIFIGGEPTISPELFPALEALRAMGMGTGHVVMSNGLRLADPALVARLADAGVSTVHLSIDTADEAVYERLSRSRGTFQAQWRALANVLAEPRLNLYVYSVLARPSVPTYPALLARIAETAAAAGRTSPVAVGAFVKPVGDALAHAEELLLAPLERAAAAREAVAAGRRAGVVVGLRNLQACLAPELEPHLADYYLEDYSVDVHEGRREVYAHNREHLAPVEACRACGHRAACPGVYRDELRRHGEEAYRTLPAPRPPTAAPPPGPGTP